MQQITIHPDALAAVSLASSTDEKRYYLNGVSVEVYESDTLNSDSSRNEGKAGLIATDGHRLMAWQTTDQPIVAQFIIPRADCAALFKQVQAVRKAAGRHMAPHVRLQVQYERAEEHEPWQLTITVALGEMPRSVLKTTAVDGNFPDWRRIIPSQDCREPVNLTGFNASYMMDFAKAGQLLTGGRNANVRVDFFSPGEPMIVKPLGAGGLGTGDLLCVLMPYRV